MTSKLNKLLLTLMIAGGGCAAGGDLDANAAAAVDVAKATLAAELKVESDQIELDDVAATEWPDSSLGCPQEGYSYLQMITPGYKVRLRVAGNTYTVHVAGQRGVMC